MTAFCCHVTEDFAPDIGSSQPLGFPGLIRDHEFSRLWRKFPNDYFQNKNGHPKILPIDMDNIKKRRTGCLDSILICLLDR